MGFKENPFLSYAEYMYGSSKRVQECSKSITGWLADTLNKEELTLSEMKRSLEELRGEISTNSMRVVALYRVANIKNGAPLDFLNEAISALQSSIDLVNGDLDPNAAMGGMAPGG